MTHDTVLLALGATHFNRAPTIKAGLGILRRLVGFTIVAFPNQGEFAKALAVEITELKLSALGVRIDQPWSKSDHGFLSMCQSLYQLNPSAVILFPPDAEATTVASIARTRGIPVYTVKSCGSVQRPR